MTCRVFLLSMFANAEQWATSDLGAGNIGALDNELGGYSWVM